MYFTYLASVTKPLYNISPLKYEIKKTTTENQKKQINMKSIRLFSLFIVKITKIITKSLHHMTDNYLQCTTFGIHIYIYIYIYRYIDIYIYRYIDIFLIFIKIYILYINIFALFKYIYIYIYPNICTVNVSPGLLMLIVLTVYCDQ